LIEPGGSMDEFVNGWQMDLMDYTEAGFDSVFYSKIN
jgi:hypothetical protein